MKPIFKASGHVLPEGHANNDFHDAKEDHRKKKGFRYEAVDFHGSELKIDEFLIVHHGGRGEYEEQQVDEAPRRPVQVAE